jgi:hypothetical protein
MCVHSLVHHAECFAQVCIVAQLLQHEVGHIGTRNRRDNGVSPDGMRIAVSSLPMRTEPGLFSTALEARASFCR